MRKFIFFCFIICSWATGLHAQRVFIAHRGVNMHGTIAGENSLEAISLAKRAGFQAIETDVRLSADGCLVVMHDSTLNRTCLNTDGTTLSVQVPVKTKTLIELKQDFILKADKSEMRSRIPTLREFLTECKRNGLYTFIEPKLLDETGRHYKDIITLADEVLGRGNYVITSNNRANEIIRDLGVYDVRLMGILYQTAFEKIQNQGDCIMAISASRFDENEYDRYVALARSHGLMRESHADKFVHFNKINRNDINFISTDLLAPDLSGQGTLLVDKHEFKNFICPAITTAGNILLKKDQTVVLNEPLPCVTFGGIYLEIELKGNVEIELGNQTFNVKTGNIGKHQVLIYNASPAFKVKSLSDESEIKRLMLKIVQF